MKKNRPPLVWAAAALLTVTAILAVCFLSPDQTAEDGRQGYTEDLSKIPDDPGRIMPYEEKLFDTSAPIAVNILMAEDQWREMLDTARWEQYYQCDVDINGTLFSDVGFRIKGNTSLSSIASDPNNDRYSFKIEFDHYIDRQTCWGLDKLVLNNNYADATNMKEALIYDMYRFIGADASLYNFAAIYVNGEYWGIYLALEAVEESFMLRNYGSDRGELYKPDKMAGDLGPSGFGDDGPFGGGGANLNYIDNDPNSYSTIWDGEVTHTSDRDHLKVIAALRYISERDRLEKHMDTDNLLRMMAVHNFAVNWDSLSKGMAHNYYLYEDGGKLNIIPWDYNLSLNGSAAEVINDPIDDPWGSTGFFDPLLEDDAYLRRYHEYYRILTEGYIFGGGFDAFYERTRAQIDGLVETDPHALYPYTRYDAAAQLLYKIVMLRGESIREQLDEKIPSTASARRSGRYDLISSSGIDLSIMGSLTMNGDSEEPMFSDPEVNG